MKKLPNIIKVFLFSILFVNFLNFSTPTYAQSTTPSPTPDVTTGWVKDQEVTFVGKTATRSDEFLDWTLSIDNYRWITLPTGGSNNPIEEFWALVRNIVFVLLALFVLGAAFVMIITRGQNLTVMRFIPRFIIIIVLVVLSFALIRFLYQATDVVQGFFLNVKDPIDGTNRNINSSDLLYIAFNYDFIGFRRVGIEFDESAFISLLLVKLTAITYYVMTGLLLIRKIILWFFIIVSPIFPLLLFFRPVRNTAKIWVGEFFRWLLYAPLFALFLHGLVNVWRRGIPMAFDFSKVGTTQTYPTAINILLGGPGQQIDLNNSVNLRDTFALYVVALLMLWVVILLPFLLLQIFLDYLNNVSLSESPVIKRITSNSWFNKAYGGTPPPTPPGQPPQAPSPFGLAKSLPFFNKRAMEIPTSRATSTFTSSLERASQTNLQSIRETRDVLRLANLTIPKMRDIARYETSMMKHDTVSRSEVNRFHETLEKISKPTVVTATQDREKFTTIKEKLVSQQKKGDKLADNVLSASKISEEMNDKTKAGVPGQAAQGVSGQATPGIPGQKRESLTHVKNVKLPQTNQVQQVSIEEYEDVRKMWIENYQNMETPIGPKGLPLDKHDFLQQDIENITETINLLSSDNQENVDKGMERVANILPFLLLGGFSKAEVISYLKAKLEAAKQVLTGVDTKKEEDDTLLERKDETGEAHGEMTMQRELPEDEDKSNEQQNSFQKSQEQVNSENGGNDENNGGSGVPPGSAV